MAKTILVTGGARSGKSSFAEKTAILSGRCVAYIATAVPSDRDMEDRILKHKKSRPQEWETIEMYKDFKSLVNIKAFQSAEVLLLDCVTILVTNWMFYSGIDFDHCTVEQLEILEKDILSDVKDLIETVNHFSKDLIVVTNEVGMGLVPSYKMGNYFRDIAGRVNQKIASEADEVYLVVSGIPMKIK